MDFNCWCCYTFPRSALDAETEILSILSYLILSYLIYLRQRDRLVPQISPKPSLAQGAAHHQDRVFRAPYEAFGGRGRAVGAVGAACGAYHPVRGVSTGWLAGQYRGSARGWFAHRGLSLASHPVVRLVATPSTPLQSRLHASKLRKELHRLELGPDLALCTASLS